MNGGRIASQLNGLIESGNGVGNFLAMQGEAAAQFGGQRFLAAFFSAVDQLLRGGLFFGVRGI